MRLARGLGVSQEWGTSTRSIWARERAYVEVEKILDHLPIHHGRSEKTPDRRCWARHLKKSLFMECLGQPDVTRIIILFFIEDSGKFSSSRKVALLVSGWARFPTCGSSLFHPCAACRGWGHGDGRAALRGSHWDQTDQHLPKDTATPCIPTPTGWSPLSWRLACCSVGVGGETRKATCADSAFGHRVCWPLVFVFKWGPQPVALRASPWLQDLEGAPQAWRPHYVIRSLENELFFSHCNQKAGCSSGLHGDGEWVSLWLSGAAPWRLSQSKKSSGVPASRRREESLFSLSSYREQLAGLGTVILKPECASGSLGGLVKTQIAGPHPLSFYWVGLGWGQRICILNKFPGDSVAADLGTPIWEPEAPDPQLP